jgi:hypothetical protein
MGTKKKVSGGDDRRILWYQNRLITSGRLHELLWEEERLDVYIGVVAALQGTYLRIRGGLSQNELVFLIRGYQLRRRFSVSEVKKWIPGENAYRCIQRLESRGLIKCVNNPDGLIGTNQRGHKFGKSSFSNEYDLTLDGVRYLFDYFLFVKKVADGDQDADVVKLLSDPKKLKGWLQNL